MKNFIKYLLQFLGALHILVAPLAYYFLKPGSTELSGLLIITGVLLIILSKWNSLSELSIWGLTAKVDRVLHDASATLEQVRELAKISAQSSLANTARSGWLGGIPEDLKLELLKATKSSLHKLNFTSEEIQFVTADYHNCVLSSFRGHILRKLQFLSTDVADIAEHDRLKRKPMNDPVTPYELGEFLKKSGFWNEDTQKQWENYSHYYSHKEFKDFEDYANRKDWPEQSQNKQNLL